MNTSLADVLTKAFRVLEAEFVRINVDGADITFSELAKSLRNKGFSKTEELQDLFLRVDRQNTGGLGFAEYLALMYYFSEISKYEAVFSINDAKDIDLAFRFLETSYLQYDTDKSRTLSRSELSVFVKEKLPGITGGRLSDVCDAVFPRNSDKLTFKRFLVLLYVLLVPGGRFAESGLKSKARGAPGTPGGAGAGGHGPAPGTPGTPGTPGASPAVVPQGGRAAGRAASGESVYPEGQHAAGAGYESTELFVMLRSSFSVLEQDFSRFDTDNSNSLSLTELSEALKTKNSAQLIVVISQLEHLFRKVDLDESGGIDFVEFLYFVYLLVENGAYKEVINDAVDASAVKRAFVFLRKSYSAYDADGNQRLDEAEVSRFAQEYFGTIPPNFPQVFNRVKNPKKNNVDFVRFMQLLYEVVLPQGRYAGRPTDHVTRPRAQQQDFKSPAPGTVALAPRAPFMDKLRLAEIQKDKEIGSGGFSVVHLAHVRGQKVAAKFIKVENFDESLEEFRDEVDFMKRLDHPNLCFLVGSVIEGSSLVILTEYCENGSLFDLLHKKRRRLSKPDLHRIALEIALGMEQLHRLNPVIIHRDLKSLNILLDSAYHAKICDFGLSKTISNTGKGAQVHTQNVGTPQWTAPEVLESPIYGTPVDVYSYGIVLWEMTHNSIPYAGFDPIQIAINVLKGVRPPIKAATPKEFAELMQACWAQDPRARPTFSQIVASLRQCEKNFAQ